MMAFSLDDTIAAISTPHGAGGIGVIRISGPEAASITESIFAPFKAVQNLDHAKMVLGHITDAKQNRILDTVLVTRFVSPASYTGDDTVEIHAHGGWLNLEDILTLVLAHGARAAGPGEFTMRAFVNGKLDLTEAEAVRDVIESKTNAALAASRRHLDGEISQLCQELRQIIVGVLAHIEAMIDFPDESLPLHQSDAYSKSLQEASQLLTRTNATYERGRLLREGIEAIIIGKPNVGKSSLLNRILRSERAIVADEPGTTRDLIEAVADIGGVPVRFVDTAGIRETSGGVESIGVDKALERLESCDLALLVLDGAEPFSEDSANLAERLSGKPGIVIINKSDLPQAITEADLQALQIDWPQVSLSALTGEGIDALDEALHEALHGDKIDPGSVVLTSARHHAAFAQAADALVRADDGLNTKEPAWELISADLHDALSALDEVVGLTTPDDILNEIFGSFCIGK